MPIYLDYASTTPVDARAVDAMLRCMLLPNPSAAYSQAGAARREMRLARQQIAKMLSVDHAAVFFTSGGSESNAWALQAGCKAAVSCVEHASVLQAAPNAIRIPVNADGLITPEALDRALAPGADLVSIQWANNETGVIQPIADLYPIVQKHGALLHVDAVQAFGHVPVDGRCCDLISLSAHKFYGPRGAGCLYIRPGVRFAPLIPGGGQEGGRRGGTENVPAIAGMGAAAQAAQADMQERDDRERALMDGFLQELAIPGMTVLGQNAPRLPNIAAIHIPGLDAETAIARLDLMGIQLSGGAACHSHTHEPSHVYLAMGLTPREARQVLRISIGRQSTQDDLSTAAQAIRTLAQTKL